MTITTKLDLSSLDNITEDHSGNMVRKITAAEVTERTCHIKHLESTISKNAQTIKLISEYTYMINDESDDSIFPCL